MTTYATYSPPPLSPAEVTDTNNATTTSGTDALLTSMTMTPVAGTYLFWFASSITSNAAGAAISYSFYVAGAQKGETLCKISPLDGGTLSVGTARGAAALTSLITVNGTQAVEVRWSMSSGTATCGPRTLTRLRVG